MADELKKKFQEMQEAKHGKKSDILVDEFGFLIAAGPMNIATGLDHIHSWKGYVPVALWPVYPLLPRGVPY